MQLPDENIEYNYQRLLAPSSDAWTALAELQGKNFLNPESLEQIKKEAMAVRVRDAAERELVNATAKDQPVQAGFIDLPQKMLDAFRRKQDASELGKIIRISNRLREEVDRVVVLGIGGSYLGARALFDALCHAYHNEMPANLRMGKPRMYFEGNNVDNDSLQELLELLENTCVDPAITEERWGAIVISKSGGTLETAAAFRAVKAEVTRFGSGPDVLPQVVVPITGPKESSAICAPPTAIPTTTCSRSRTRSVGGSVSSRRSDYSRPRSRGSTSERCCSARRR